MTHRHKYFAELVTFGLDPAVRPTIQSAFEKVRREDFAGAPPYLLNTYMSGRPALVMSEEPEDLYQDVLICLDQDQRINIGQPSLWAYIFAETRLAEGMQVYQSGSGSGYYTAVISEIVGVSGRVFYDEIDDKLQRRTEENLRALPRVEFGSPTTGLDRIYFFYGCSRIRTSLLQNLDVGSIISIPATDEHGRGRFYFISRNKSGSFHIKTGVKVYFVTDRNYASPLNAALFPECAEWDLSESRVGAQTENEWFELRNLMPR